MQHLTVIELLKQVIMSWQVIAVTIGVILYLQIVFYVSRKRRGPAKIHKMSANKEQPKAEKPAKDEIKELDEEQPGKSSNDELGLEEE